MIRNKKRILTKSPIATLLRSFAARNPTRAGANPWVREPTSSAEAFLSDIKRKKKLKLSSQVSEEDELGAGEGGEHSANLQRLKEAITKQYGRTYWQTISSSSSGRERFNYMEMQQRLTAPNELPWLATQEVEESVRTQSSRFVPDNESLQKQQPGREKHF